MSVSRYQNTFNKDYDYHNTFKSIKATDLYSETDFFYRIKDGERIDQIAQRFLGNSSYWWIIALMNNLNVPFDDKIRPGTVLRITNNINVILSKLI